MDTKYLNEVIDYPLSLFQEDFIWKESDYIKLNNDLNILLEKFLEELEKNIFAKKLLKKEDIWICK